MMVASSISPVDLETLRRFDTPTVCNALELIVPDRRGHGYTTQPLIASDPSLPPVVGYARTAIIRARTPSSRSPEEQQARRFAYYEYLAMEPGPTVTVIHDDDPEPGYGAFWGEVNSAIHKGLGCVGCVTDGSYRDIEQIAPGFQILGRSIGPSHAFVHVVAYGGPVTISGMAVQHNDIIHADRHGAVVIPESAVRALPEAVETVTRREKVILDAARRPGFSLDRLRQAMADAANL